MTGAAVADRHVHPATVPLRFAKDAPRTLLGIPAAFAFISEKGVWSVLIVLGVAALLGLLWQYMAWRRFRYGFGAHEIVIESGLFTRNRRSIPFERVQDVSLEQGPLARLFGLVRLRIETGGGAGEEGLIDSVRLDEAERIRAALRRGREEAPPALREEADVAPGEAPVLFAMTPIRVLVTGLFNFSLTYLAIPFVLLQSFGELLPFDPYDFGRWLGLVGDNVPERVTVGAVLAVLLLAALLGVVTGVVRTVTQDWGFRLTIEGRGLRRVRGLLTRSEMVLPRSRVQLARMTSGVLRRRFGWAALSVQTVGQEEKKGCRHERVAPLARAFEIDDILAALPPFRVAAPGELRRASSRHLWRKLILAGWFSLAVAAASIFWRPALLLLLLTPLFVLDGLIGKRFNLFGRSGGLVFIQTGILRRRQWIIPVERIQSVRLSRSPVQRLLRLATVALDTMGGSSMSPPRMVDLAEDEARQLIASLRLAPAAVSGVTEPTCLDGPSSPTSSPR